LNNKLDDKPVAEAQGGELCDRTVVEGTASSIGGPMKKLNVILALAALLGLAGCASTYQLTLMPKNSGKLYYGEAFEKSGSTEATVNITIEDKTYSGTWVAATPDRTTGTVSAGVGFGGRHGGFGIGTAPVIVDNPSGGESKALLQAADGSGLRCDFKGTGTGRSGGGMCTDDKGTIYDVQIRVKG
jgi:uncharacterized protein YceK